MRRSVALDPDVERLLQAEAERTKRPLGRVINDALRVGLGVAEAHGRAQPYRTVPHAFGPRPGVDLDKLGQIDDLLDSAEAARRLGRDAATG